MIDKRKVGLRLAAYRRGLSMTQEQLAEKLGVTPQAVSRWENGLSIPEIESLLIFSRLAKVTINDLLEGEDIFEKITKEPYLYEDIAYYTGKDEADKDWAERIRNQQWILRNYESQKKVHDAKGPSSVSEAIIAHGGLVLETGVGPGGGFAIDTLLSNPFTHLILNDLSPTVLQEWNKQLSTCPADGIIYPNIHFAAFSFLDIPFKDETIDVVSDGGGIGNVIGGDKNEVYKEVFRILKKDGLFITGGGYVTKETLSSLPKEASEMVETKRPDMLDNCYNGLVEAGFTHIETVVSRGWYTDDDDSTFADLARSLGVNIKVTGLIRFCRK